ncbi:Multiple PDZ domain protein [Nymphon striatum]|nr:Multiple PDZ domain protein [Nymphon striatum]
MHSKGVELQQKIPAYRSVVGGSVVQLNGAVACRLVLIPVLSLQTSIEFINSNIALDFEESLCVEDVFYNGAAGQDGRLRKGDLLLSVNDWSLKNVTFEEGVNLIRSSTSPVRLTILRENPYKLFCSREEPSKFVTVELRKNTITDRIGISIMELRNSKGVCITYIEPGGIAATQSRLMLQGDQIFEINGTSVKDWPLSKVAEHLKNLGFIKSYTFIRVAASEDVSTLKSTLEMLPLYHLSKLNPRRICLNQPFCK